MAASSLPLRIRDKPTIQAYKIRNRNRSFLDRKTKTIMSELSIQNNQVMSPFFNTASFEEAQRMGAMLAAASMGVPREYQNNLPNCVVAIEYAHRLGVSPIMVMQNTDVIHGKAAPKATFIIALINASGKFAEDLYFEYFGTKGTDGRGCYAWTKRKDGSRVEGSEVTVTMAKAEGWYGKPGSKWPNMTDQMLAYRAASFFSRIHCPSVTMGMQSSDEIEDVGVMETMQDKSIINDINAQVAPPPPASDYVQFEEIPAEQMEAHQSETVSAPPPPPPAEYDDF